MKKLKRILPVVLVCVLLFGNCLSVNAAYTGEHFNPDIEKIENYIINTYGGSIDVNQYIYCLGYGSGSGVYIWVTDGDIYAVKNESNTEFYSTGKSYSVIYIPNTKEISVYNKGRLIVAGTRLFGGGINVDNISSNFNIKYDTGDIFYYSSSSNSTNTYDTDAISGSILVTAEVGSTYSITLPATLALSKNDETGKYEGEYIVGVKANLTGNEAVTVTPDSTVTLTNEGGDSVDGTVSQSVNTWRLTASSANEIVSDYQNFVKTTGKVIADLQKSGTYSGNLNFTFTKTSDQGGKEK